MTKADFMARLRRGLAALSPATLAEITADYEAHFEEAASAGRSEEETAAALGDPDRLARELRAEYGLKAWEEKKSPANATGAILALLGLGAIDVLILAPILFSLISVILSLAVAVVVVFFVGGAVMIAGPFVDYGGGAVMAVLAGLGLVGGATGFGALLTLATVGLVNALVWYARLHFKLLKPAIEAN
ncbi:MAG TPA: DUF1700 domain-containing protein [Caulobacter sp.]|nr:DUF1700 domain-containing protein [Caulobacter sp.]